MYSVVLVDDERLIVRGLKTVINWTELGCEVTGTAYDGAGGLELIRRSFQPAGDLADAVYHLVEADLFADAVIGIESVKYEE